MTAEELIAYRWAGTKHEVATLRAEIEECSKASREAYKSALRKAIEEKVKDAETGIEKLEEDGQHGTDDWLTLISARNALKMVLYFIDTVNPE